MQGIYTLTNERFKEEDGSQIQLHTQINPNQSRMETLTFTYRNTNFQ